MSVDLSDDYRPSDDEEFMNERQLAYFRRLCNFHQCFQTIEAKTCILHHNVTKP